MNQNGDRIVDLNDCQTIIENVLKSTDFQVENYNVKSLADTVTGMMAEYYTLIIDFTRKGQKESKQFFCKKLVMFHKIQEIMGKAQGAFEKEDFIYNFLVKECEKIPGYNISYAPECYLTIKDDLFVLEDLTEQGYKVFKQRYDLNHLKQALKTVARFHASSVIYEEKISIQQKTKYSLNNDYKHVFADSLYRQDENYLGRKWFKNCYQTIEKLIEISPFGASEKIKENLKLLKDKIYEIIAPSTHFNNVLCHGDLSNVNILFKYDPNTNEPIDCKLVDFQALRYTPPAHDVLTCIYLSAERTVRKKHLNDLLEWYHTQFHWELEEHCVDKENHVVLEMFRESCDYVLPMVVFQALAYLTMEPIKYYPHIKTDQELYKKYVYVDRSPECIETYKKDDKFKEKFDDYLEIFNSL